MRFTRFQTWHLRVQSHPDLASCFPVALACSVPETLILEKPAYFFRLRSGRAFSRPLMSSRTGPSLGLAALVGRASGPPPWPLGCQVSGSFQALLPAHLLPRGRHQVPLGTGGAESRRRVKASHEEEREPVSPPRRVLPRTSRVPHFFVHTRLVVNTSLPRLRALAIW